MLIINETYFTGEISIPQLPTSSIGDAIPRFGTKVMIQTAGENNLGTFIDEKTTEYLRLMFGEQLASDLIDSWYMYVGSTDTEDTELAILNSSTPVKTWVEIPNRVVDILFSDFIVSTVTPKILRHSDVKVYEWAVADITVKLKIRRGIPSVYISGIPSSDITIFEHISTERPSEFLRIIFNSLLLYKGTRKCSPIANYVWFWLNRDSSNYTTSMGEADLNFTRASNAYEADKFLKQYSFSNKQIRAWNGMVSMNRDIMIMLRHMRHHITDYWIPTVHWKALTSNINVYNI